MVNSEQENSHFYYSIFDLFFSGILIIVAHAKENQNFCVKYLILKLKRA